MGMVCDFIKSSREFQRLFKQVDKNTENIDSNRGDINLILQYYNKTEDGVLQHIYDSFPLLYNSQYVKAVNPHIKVDPLAGIVYYDLRFLMKAGFPVNESVIIARCPNDYMPQMSAPCSWAVRNNYVNDSGNYEPVYQVLLKDGKGAFSYTSVNSQGPVVVIAEDEIEENQFLYLSGSYFMKKSSMGRQDLDKSLVEYDEFVTIDKLIGHKAE